MPDEVGGIKEAEVTQKPREEEPVGRVQPEKAYSMTKDPPA